MSLTTTAPTLLLPRTAARPAAAFAASLLAVNGVCGVLGGDDSDHFTGLGLLSELTAGAAFVAAAVALVALTPVTGWRGLLWWLAPAGLTVAGGTMLAVPVVGQEPAEWLFVLAVLPTFVGLVAAGVLGTRRVWPGWVGAGVALLLPIMFLLPLNGFLMAVVWTSVAVTAPRDRA